MIAIVFTNSSKSADIKATLSASEAIREFMARSYKTTGSATGPRSYMVMQSMSENTFDALASYLNSQKPEEDMVITYLCDVTSTDITPQNIADTAHSADWLSLMCKAKIIASAEQGPMHIDSKWSTMTSSTTVFLHKIRGHHLCYKELVEFLKDRNIVCDGPSSSFVEALQSEDLPDDLELETQKVSPFY